jgi:hypothetical protein
VGTTPLAPATGSEPPSGSPRDASRGGELKLYLAETRQLFNSLDPAPFRQRDLDPEAAAYIVDWAREAPADVALRLVLHIGGGAPTEDDAAMLRKSVHEYFGRRALVTWRQLRQLFRIGRYSLLIALVFLALVIVVGESIASLISRKGVASLIEDSLVIGGWVALWRPLEIFLYDWWPIRAEAQLFDRLSQMDVRILGAPANQAGTGDAVAS